MFGPTGMAIGTGPFYTNAIMGQAPSTQERENLRKGSSSILREDSIHIEDSELPSRPDSWSMHYDCTIQAPYATETDGNMMTQTSLLLLPKDNPSRDLAFFLRSTGPTAPHRRPSKVDNQRRAVSASKNALRFLKVGQRRPTMPVRSAHQRLTNVLHDEGGLLAGINEEKPLLKGVEQKVSVNGKKYLALQVPSVNDIDRVAETAPTLSPDILESRVSVSFADDIRSSDVLDNWLFTLSNENIRQGIAPFSRKASTTFPVDDEHTVRIVQHSSPIRPAASNPPTPQLESAVSIAESYQNDLSEHPAKRSLDALRALSSHPVSPDKEPNTPIPKLALPKEEFPVRFPNAKKLVEIKHPSPRRFASHPVLLQRASSIASSMYPRSFSDSPGPPPPKSPLRLRRDPRSIEDIIQPAKEVRKGTPQVAPSIRSVSDCQEEVEPIKPTVVTDCYGPIKRPKSRGEKTVRHPAYPASRKEREERIKARKLSDRPAVSRTIDAVVNASNPLPRQRLRKARPHIQIPDLKPAPLATRASSSASSNASWKKVTQSTLTPISSAPSPESQQSNGEKTGYTPTSPTASNGSTSAGAEMALSPVMLVAEQIPVPKAKSPSKPARLVLREGKSYAPRPRSASMTTKRRSRNSIRTISRPATPGGEKPKTDDTPPLPSPPPNRALPPTPPASGSEQPKRSKHSSKTSSKASSPANRRKDLPIPPAYEISPKAATPPPAHQPIPHVATQLQPQRHSVSSKGSSHKASRIDARLEALEKQNALLSAALMAVLKTNGALNTGPLSGLVGQEESNSSGKGAMAWEGRVARRSAASRHQASSSNGSALEMYMSTRMGSTRESKREN